MRLIAIYNLHRLPLIGAALWLLLGAGVHAAPLRVTTWSLQPKASLQTNQVQKSAALLKKLNPDVIILQQVENWQSCDELIKELRPRNYSLAVCSSFRDARTGALSREQVAILSKAKSYISWSEGWKGASQKAALPGGFAFAAVRLGNKNVGLFSVQLGDADLSGVDDPHSANQQQAREESTRQLLRQIAALNNWSANRIDALVVAGDFNTGPDDSKLADEKTFALLGDSGLANAFNNVPLEKRITFPGNGQGSEATLDYIFMRNAGLIASPQITPVAWSEHYPVTCELDLNAPKPVPVPAFVPVARVEMPPVSTPKNLVKPKEEMLEARHLVSHQDGVSVPKQATALTASSGYNVWWFAGAGTGALLLMLFVWQLARRSRAQPATASLLAMKVESGASISLPSDAERIVITHRPAETTGSVPNRPTIVHIETPGVSQTQSQAWQRRAEEAERRAQQATVVLRAGLIPHLSRWLKEKLVRKLVSDRAQLMEVQRVAALKMLAVDERLSKIESQIQQRNQDYEQRIDELMKELAVAKEENRELIQAKITLVKAEMERAKQSELRTSNTKR